MRKIRLGMWICGIGLLLSLSGYCLLLVPEIPHNRDWERAEQFDPAGVWVRQEGTLCRNFYFCLTEESNGTEGRYTMYYCETDVVPAAAESFRQTDLWSTEVQFNRARYRYGILLCAPEAAVRRSELRLQPLDADHVLLLGEAELEGIYTRQRPGGWQNWSDWYLLQLHRWVNCRAYSA